MDQPVLIAVPVQPHDDRPFAVRRGERIEQVGLQVVPERQLGPADAVRRETLTRGGVGPRALEHAREPAVARAASRQGARQHARGARRRVAERPVDLLLARRGGVARPKRTHGKALRIDRLPRQRTPAVEGVTENPGLDLRVRFPAEHRVEKVHEVLDIAGGRLVLAAAQAQPDVLVVAEQLVHAARGPIGLLEAERIARRLRKSRIHHQTARRDEREQRVLIDGQLVLPAGKEAQPRMKPVRLHAGQELDALVRERLGGVAPWIALAAVATRGDDRANPLVDRSRQEGLLAVARVPGQSNPALVDLRQRFEVVDRTRRRPRAPRERGPVELRIELDPRVRIVHVARPRIGGPIHARDVPPADGGVDPGTGPRVIRQKDRERPGAVGDDQLHAKGRAMVRSELEPHFTNRRLGFVPRGRDRRPHVARRRRHRPEDPMRDLRAQERLLTRPLRRRGHRRGPAALVHQQRIREIRAPRAWRRSRAAARPSGAPSLPTCGRSR